MDMESQGSILAQFLPLIVLFGIFYFLIIRPQQKQAKAHKEMIESLKKGDKIITNGGLICEVVKPEDEFIKAKLNDDTFVKISKDFIAKKVEA
jgi:preprotein translocase subunit YajC